MRNCRKVSYSENVATLNTAFPFHVQPPTWSATCKFPTNIFSKCDYSPVSVKLDTSYAFFANITKLFLEYKLHLSLLRTSVRPPFLLLSSFPQRLAQLCGTSNKTVANNGTIARLAYRKKVKVTLSHVMKAQRGSIIAVSF
jgi:hypothetical protein